MTRLYEWAARRAGGRITITHSGGKVTAVDAIQVLDGKIIANAADGQEYELSLEPAPAVAQAA